MDLNTNLGRIVEYCFYFKVSSADESAANLASGLHTSWRHSEWCKNNAFFKLDQTTGQIIVPEDGLYLIYVQVRYNIELKFVNILYLIIILTASRICNNSTLSMMIG